MSPESSPPSAVRAIRRNSSRWAPTVRRSAIGTSPRTTNEGVISSFHPGVSRFFQSQPRAASRTARAENGEGGPSPSRSTVSVAHPNGGGRTGASGSAAGKRELGFDSEARNAASGASGSRNRNALTMVGLHRVEPRTSGKKQAPCHTARKCNLLRPSEFFNVT
jgi:hypothetical protein